MLSPAGVVEVEPDFDLSKVQLKKGKGPPKLLRKLAKTIWKHKWSPFGAMRKSGSWLGKRIIKSYLNRRMADLPKPEYDDMLDYMH